MMISDNVKEFLKWSEDMDHRVKQTIQEESESEKFHHSKNSEFVLRTQRELREIPALRSDREIVEGTQEDEAFKELESRLK